MTEFQLAKSGEVVCLTGLSTINLAMIPWWYNFFRNFGNGRLKSFVKAAHQVVKHRTRLFPMYWF